ncbi:MAG: HlyC/CorC family transporter [Clostridiales bacterium]|nr:HlyC/CorC family transporter [Clostridiales bacterium]
MDDPGQPTLIGSIVLILILTLINAILAGAEMAFVSLNPAKIKDMADRGDKKARRVQRLLKDSDSFISAIQVGITFGGFFNSASASQAFVGRLAPLLGMGQAAETAATIIVTLLISYITLVLGELYPKQVALQVPEQYARGVSGIIAVLKAAFRPFIWLLNVSTGVLKRLTPIDFTKKEEKLTRHEIKALLNSSHNDGAIDMEEFNMMRGVLSLDSRIVREIMVPRVDTDMIDADDPEEENLRYMLQQKHSRVPIYREEKDSILGIVHLKDVFLHQDALRQGRETLETIARPALFVPDTLSTDEMLIKFQKSKQHMAVLVDEFGGVAGIVTLNDLISEIVGEIHDEHDEDAGDYQIIDDTEVMLKGSMPVSDLNRVFNLDIQTEDADTVAGYIIEQLGYIPQQTAQEVVTSERYSFTVVEATGTRIETILMKLFPPGSAPDDDAAGAEGLDD